MSVSDWNLRTLRPGRRTPRPQPGDGTEPAPERSMEPGSPTLPPDADSSVVDAAVYRNGRRVASLGSLAEAYQPAPDEPDAMTWIGMYRPAEEQLLAAAEVFGLHELAVEDAIVAHQRPKLDRYGDTLFVVLRAARYRDETEDVDFGELHIFLNPDFVLTVRHSEAPDLSGVRRRLEADPDLLRLGTEAVLYAILDAVVDGYAPVVAGLQNDIDEIEIQVFAGDPTASRRIYELSREVVEFQRATRPLLGMLEGLSAGFEKYRTGEELQRYLRDVADHATLVVERVDGFRQMLSDILAVNATLVTQSQNEEMKRLSEAGYAQNEEIKKISSWAAILFAPTLIGTVYGMNFEHMPELGWAGGYPFALLLMLATCCGLYGVFKHRGWL
jgi:magnesium transporter